MSYLLFKNILYQYLILINSIAINIEVICNLSVNRDNHAVQAVHMGYPVKVSIKMISFHMF